MWPCARDDGGGSQGINEKKGRKGWFWGGRWGFVPNFGLGFEGIFWSDSESVYESVMITRVDALPVGS